MIVSLWIILFIFGVGALLSGGYFIWELLVHSAFDFQLLCIFIGVTLLGVIAALLLAIAKKWGASALGRILRGR